MTLGLLRSVDGTRDGLRSMRVAQVTEYYYPHLGGICEHVHYLSAALRRRGAHVDIITPRIDDAPAEPGVIHLGRSVPLPYNGSHARISAGVHLARRLRALLASGDYDIIHLHAPLTPSLPVLALAPTRAALVGTWHTQFARSIPFRVLRKTLQRRLDRLDVAIAVSPTARHAMQRYFDADWRIIPNGVDTTLFRPGHAAPEIMRDGRPSVLFVGRPDPRNGLSTLLHAWPRVVAATDAQLVIVGDGPLRRHYERAARGLAAVSFVGALGEERAAYYANATVYACPTTRASFGITLLEAMASGRPMACSDIAGFRDLVCHDREALLVRSGSVEGLAASLIRLLRDPQLRARLGCAGLERAAAYDWEVVTDSIVAGYRDAQSLHGLVR